MDKHIMITRYGKPAYEREVAVRTFRGKKLVNIQFIDPQREIWMATSLSLSRHKCVVSFVQGIRAAGCPVSVNDQRKGRERPSVHVTQNLDQALLDPNYYLFGLLWGWGYWDIVKRVLEPEVPLIDQRLTLWQLINADIIRM
jgi:hypothetical protein